MFFVSIIAYYLPDKNAKQDSHGVSPLKDKDSGNTFSQNKDKANLLNKQFQSVFSQLSPLKLSQLCIDKLQDYFSVRIPSNATILKCLKSTLT